MAHVNDFENGLDTETAPLRRFHKQSNIQYKFESAEALLKDLDELSAIIKHHVEYQRPRLNVLDDYYKGDNTAISVKQRRKEEDKADHRARHNYAKYVAGFMQGYFVGVPVAVHHTDKSTQEKVNAINETIEDAALNAEITLDLSIYGRAYELLHRNQQDEAKSYLSSPLETFLIYDTTIEKNVIAGVRHFTVGYGESQKVKVLLYTRNKIYTYFANDFDNYSLKPAGKDAVKDHPFGDVPINEYSNNRFRQGDFETVLDLIDLYDAAQSDTANYMTDLNDAMLKIIGNVNLTTEEARKQKQANIILLKPVNENPDGNDGKVDADYIYKKYDVSGSEAYKGRVQTDIHKFTNTPDLNDDNFAGQQSGEAMKYKLFGLEQIRINKERLFKRSLNRRYKLINNVMTTASEANRNEFEGLTYKFTPNLPKSTKEAVEMFNLLGGQLSQETTLQTIPMIVEHPEEEQKRIDKERAERRESMSSNYMEN